MLLVAHFAVFASRQAIIGITIAPNDAGVATRFLIEGAVYGICLVLVLWPLATVTDACSNPAFNQRSVVSVAARFNSRSMSTEASQELTRYMLHLHHSPMGVRIGGFLVTK